MLSACPAGGKPLFLCGDPGLLEQDRICQWRETKKETALRTMLKTIAAAALLAAAPAVQAQSASPANAATALPDKAYGQLYDAIIGGFDFDALGARMVDDVYNSILRARPEMAALDQQRPGMRQRFAAICMPYFKLWLPRSRDIARQRSVIELAKSLTPADARQLAGFYTSPLGQKVIKAVGNNLTFDATIDASMKGKGSAAGQRTDAQNSTAAATSELLETLTPTERREFEAFMKSGAFNRIGAMNAALARSKNPTPEEISTPEERAAFGKAIVDFLSAETQPG